MRKLLGDSIEVVCVIGVDVDQFLQHEVVNCELYLFSLGFFPLQFGLYLEVLVVGVTQDYVLYLGSAL